MKRYSFWIISILITLSSCQSETLLPETVIKPAVPKQGDTDTWIRDSLVTPYGIDVRYRWDKYAAPQATLTPPREKNVLAVLKVIKHLWIDLFNDPRIGSPDFIRNTAPREIFLYAGKNIFVNQLDFPVEVMATQGSPTRMYLYNIDAFDATDKKSVRNLMRMVFHCFAKTLADQQAFDQEAFLKLSPTGYTDWEHDVSSKTPFDVYAIDFRGGYAFGFYSYAARKKMLDDFAETISIMLTHTRQEVDAVIELAGRPAGSVDPEAAARMISSPKALKDKREFVSAYFADNWGVNLLRAQTISAINTQKILN